MEIVQTEGEREEKRNSLSIILTPLFRLANVFDESELDEKVVIAKIATTTQHGAIEGKTQTKDVNIYNLDAIIASF